MKYKEKHMEKQGMGTYSREREAYLDQIDHQRRRRKHHALLLGIIALGVILFAAVCTISMKMEEIHSKKQYVKNYTEQRGSLLGIELENGRAEMTSLRESVERIGSWDIVAEFLKKKREVYQLDFLAVYDAPTGTFLMEGEARDSESREAFRACGISQKAAKLGECVADIVNGSLLYAVPISQDGQVRGMMWAGDRTDSLNSILSTKAFNGESVSYLVAEDGRELLASHSTADSRLWSQMASQTEDGRSSEVAGTVMNALRSGESGVFRFRTSDHKPYYLSYGPTGVNGWMTVTILPSSLFMTFSDWYVILMLGSLLTALAVFGAFFLQLLRSSNDNEKRLEELALTDEVTGGINKIDFRMKYHELCRKGEADQFAVALLDCVDFKAINETQGLKMGDEMLAYFYQVIRRRLSQERGEFVSRTEMDYFFLCMREKSPSVIAARLEEIEREINEFSHRRDLMLPGRRIMFRRGVSFVQDNQTDISIIQDQARIALKGQTEPEVCVFFDAAAAEKIQKEREIEQLFDRAVQNEEFQVYFQPKVSLSQNRITGAEALVRWNRPGSGVISPGEFIPVLERSGKIRALDRYVFEKVCIWLGERKRREQETFPVSVNLSRSNFIYDSFLEEFIEIADRHQADRNMIELEVTETVFLTEENIQKVKREIRAIHDCGFRCALDDFGVGFSSLTLLKEFNIDSLKMDRSFFSDLDNAKTRNVISCILELAEQLDMETVAEGIETEEQIDSLRRLGCDVVQGYYFSRPLPQEQFERWIQEFEEIHVREDRE